MTRTTTRQVYPLLYALRPPYGVGDFAAWFEAYIGGDWYTFDPRNNVPRREVDEGVVAQAL